MIRLGRGVATLLFATLIGGIAWADWKFNPHTGKLDYYEVTGSTADNSITNVKINSAANIDATKLGTGLVTNTEFSYLDSVTSPIQTQLDGKQASLGFTAENSANKSDNTSLGTSTTLYPTQNAVKTYADTKQAALGFTPENVANKGTDNALGTSDTIYPSQRAVKQYVDANAGGTIADNSIAGVKLNFPESFDFVYSTPSLLDNTSIRTLPYAVTIQQIRGVFTDIDGAISTANTDNVSVQLSFCSPDNVVSCTSIDNTTIIGGTVVYSDSSMGGTSSVPAYSPLVCKLAVVNTSKIFNLTIVYKRS